MKTFKKITFLFLLSFLIPYFVLWMYIGMGMDVLTVLIVTSIICAVSALLLIRQIPCFTNEKKCYVENLESKQIELRQIIDLVPGFIYSKDLNGKILLVNEALARFLNVSSVDLIGKNESEIEILDCLTNKEIEDEILSSVGMGSVSAEECDVGIAWQKRRASDFTVEEGYSQNKEYISTYLVFRAPLFNKSNSKVGILVFAYDITTLKNVQQNLELLNSSLEARVKEEVEKNSTKDKELMRAKEKFVRNAVHELNSALTVITLNAEYLMEEYGKNRSTSAILGAAKKLSNSYDDLSYSTVKDSPHYQEEKEIDLSDILSDRIKFFEDIAELSDITIKSEIVSDVKVVMNVVKLTRVIDNNLSNAIKYSYPKNSIIIRCFCDNNRAILEFESIGKKIEDRDKIFDLYSREDGAKRGHGVGLNMVKEICDESKIDIEVICDANKNTFRYRFSYAC